MYHHLFISSTRKFVWSNVFSEKQVGTHNKVGDLLMEGQNISMIMMITRLQITRTDNYDLSDENWYREETGGMLLQP